MQDLQNSDNRKIESTFIKELLCSLEKIDPTEFKKLSDKLDEDELQLKDVNVITLEIPYYFSNKTHQLSIENYLYTQVRKIIAQVCNKSNVTPGVYAEQAACSAIRGMQKQLTTYLEEYIKKFDPLFLHSKLLEQYSALLHSMFVNLHRRKKISGLEPEILEEVKMKSAEIRENDREDVRSVLYAIETNLFISNERGEIECDGKELSFILAFTHWLIQLQTDSDLCYYNDSDVSIDIDSEYCVNTILSESSKLYNEELIKRKYNADGYHVELNSTDKEYAEQFALKFQAATGVNFVIMMTLLDFLCSDATKLPCVTEVSPNVFSVATNVLLEYFMDQLEDSDKIKIDELISVINYLTIDSTKLKTLNSTTHDILPVWDLEKRIDRFDIKPIIQKGASFIYSPIIVHDVMSQWANGIYNWYLPYETGC